MRNSVFGRSSFFFFINYWDADRKKKMKLVITRIVSTKALKFVFDKIELESNCTINLFFSYITFAIYVYAI